MINHKINSTAPDEICVQCKQQYQGDCRAFNFAHSDEELKQRFTGGCECDPKRIREYRSGQSGKLQEWEKPVIYYTKGI